MPGHRITQQTARTIANIRRAQGRLGNGSDESNRPNDWPHLQPVKIVDAITASDGETPETGDGKLLRWNPASEELEELGDIPLFSLSRSSLQTDQIRLAIQDAFGNHWVVDTSINAGVDFQLTASYAGAGVATAAVVLLDYSGRLAPTTPIQVVGKIDYGTVASGSTGIAIQQDDSTYAIVEMKGSSSGGGSGSDAGILLLSGTLGTRGGSASDPITKFAAHASDNIAYINAASIGVVFPSPGTAFAETVNEAANPFGLNGSTGDHCLLVKQNLPEESTDNPFVLLAVYPLQATIFFTLDEDRDYNIRTTELAVRAVKSWRHPGQGPDVLDTYQVHDRFSVAVNAKAGHLGYAQWNQNTGEWVVIACERNAMQSLCTINEDFTGADSLVEVTNLLGLDGDIPDADQGPLDVKNLFKYSGKENAKGFLQYKPDESKWILMNVQCEDSTPPIV